MKKTLIVGMIIMACGGMAYLPAVVAAGNGSGVPVASFAALSPAESDMLVFMREEEKLARDVYKSLYQQWKLPVFNNIAASEQQHTSRVKMLLDKYGLVDPVVDDTVGAFTNTQLADLYVQLLARGKTSALAALQVGAFIEETDIADLQKAIKATTHPDIARIYGNLLKASRNHLRAFIKLIENQGVTYTAQALPQTELDAIADSPFERGNAGGGRGNGRR